MGVGANVRGSVLGSGSDGSGSNTGWFRGEEGAQSGEGAADAALGGRYGDLKVVCDVGVGHGRGVGQVQCFALPGCELVQDATQFSVLIGDDDGFQDVVIRGVPLTVMPKFITGGTALLGTDPINGTAMGNGHKPYQG